MVGMMSLIFLLLIILGVPIAYCMGLGAFAALITHMPNSAITVASKMFGGLDCRDF